MKEELRTYLKDRDQSLTQRRELVCDIMEKIGKHCTADELYFAVRKKEPEIGQATVFRTINLLVEAGLIREVDLGDKKHRYEVISGHEHHDHIVCIKCGLVIEAMDEKLEKEKMRVSKKYGFRPVRHRLEIFGLCEKCQ